VAELYVGLMSGTSLDGVDGVLADFSKGAIQVLAHASADLPSALRQELLALNSAGPNELHRAALAANSLVHIYAKVVADVLAKSGIEPSQIRAIGAHGQTVRHQPQAFDGTGYTLQLNNPALLAELTGIDVVADFRSRDVAAGGQGAPLVPLFHQAVFGRKGHTVAVLNIGGIANLTVLGSELSDDVLGFDCGPGNALMDAWCQQHRGQPFDTDGAWAASGQVHEALLKAMLAEPYFALPAPKSTGRDLFHATWLSHLLQQFPAIKPVDVQATLCELTASSCAADVLQCGANSERLIVCGGGALNGQLMRRLQAHSPSIQVGSSQQEGLPPLQVEATAFAWLARKTVLRETASLPKVTGAQGARILGALYASGRKA
jgi:anhydro-N-acetylmuramic acid kinase